MKKILIPILILPLMFFTGCSEEEETATGPDDTTSYTIDDMVGTWNMLSSTIDIEASIDFSALADMYADMFSEFDDFNGVWDEGEEFVDENANGMWDEGEQFTDTSSLQLICEEAGLTYDEETGCTMDDTMLAMMAAGACAEMEGTLTGTTCEASFSEEECCDDSFTQTMVITEEGTVTIEWSEVDEDGNVYSETETGTISIDGTDATVTINPESCECDIFESQAACEAMAGCMFNASMVECYGDYEGDCPDTVNATLSIDGDTATLEWSLDEEDFSDFMDEGDEDDCGDAMTEYECDDCGGDWDAQDSYCYSDGEEWDFELSGSATQTIVLEKVTSEN